MSRSEERARRKAEKLLKFEASKTSLLAKVDAVKEPKVDVRADENPGPRLAPHLQRQLDQQAKSPKALEDGSRFAIQVTWCITKRDCEGEWSWREVRAWTPEEWANDIEPPMNNFARLTWAEIDQLSSESGHKMHHAHEISDLVNEAQTRWRELGLEQYDSVFRFRLGGRKRLWGYLVQGHFYSVWWDRVHAIYPV